jgi:hypothetical protein
MTPTKLAVTIWGPEQDGSRSWGARTVRRAARELYGTQSKQWDITESQAAEIRALISRRGWRPPDSV